MSYDIYLRCDKCGCSVNDGSLMNPTYNLTPIFDFALTGEDLPNPDVTEAQAVVLRARTDRPRGLRLLSGRMAKDTLADINHALDRMADETLQGRFMAMQPENGWGNFAGALKCMRELKTAAEEYPERIWEIH